MKIYTFFLVVLLILTGSCKTANPRLTKTHSGIYKFGEIPNGAFLDVQVAVVPVIPPKKPSEKAKTFFDLRDSIPQTFLRVLGDKVTSGSDLVKYIKEPLEEKPEKSPERLPTDYATQKIRFVLGNIKNYQALASKEHPEFLHPNTRLASLNTTLDFSEADFEIISIDKLESEFEEIDLGTLSRTQEANFNSKLTGQFGVTETSGSTDTSGSQSTGTAQNIETENVYDEDGNLLGTMTIGEGLTDTSNIGSESSRTSTKGKGASGELGYTNKETIAEALQVKLKRLKTGFVFNRKSITVSQHGSILLDISDNVIVTATIFPKTGVGQTKVMNFSGLFVDFAPQKASAIKLNRREVKYMKCEARKVDVLVSSKGLLRTVENRMRGDQVLEFDDKVIYYPFDLSTASRNAATISNWPNCTMVYKMVHTDANGTKYDLKAGIGSAYEVHLLDDEKDLFDNWLRLQLANPSINNLQNSPLEIYLEERVAGPGLPKKRIQIVGPNIGNADLSKIKNLDIQFEVLP